MEGREAAIIDNCDTDNQRASLLKLCEFFMMFCFSRRPEFHLQLPVLLCETLLYSCWIYLSSSLTPLHSATRISLSLSFAKIKDPIKAGIAQLLRFRNPENSVHA